MKFSPSPPREYIYAFQYPPPQKSPKPIHHLSIPDAQCQFHDTSIAAWMLAADSPPSYEALTNAFCKSMSNWEQLSTRHPSRACILSPIQLNIFGWIVIWPPSPMYSDTICLTGRNCILAAYLTAGSEVWFMFDKCRISLYYEIPSPRHSAGQFICLAAQEWTNSLP